MALLEKHSAAIIVFFFAIVGIALESPHMNRGFNYISKAIFVIAIICNASIIIFIIYGFYLRFSSISKDDLLFASLIAFSFFLYLEFLRNSKKISEVLQLTKGLDKYIEEKEIVLCLIYFCVINIVLTILGLVSDIYVVQSNPEVLRQKLGLTNENEQTLGPILIGLLITSQCVWHFTIFAAASAFSLFYAMVCMMFEKAFKKLDEEMAYRVNWPMKLHIAVTELLYIVDKKINYLFLLCYIFFEAMTLRVVYTLMFSGMVYYNRVMLCPTLHAFILLCFIISAAAKVHEAANVLSEHITSYAIDKCTWRCLPLMAKVVDEEIALTLWSMVGVTKKFVMTSVGLIASYVIIIGTLKAQ
ncbi:uncharacterized protein NPIL_405511 [Nephila pilipes]|uniref:Uncharacterized protein n=1 Tax=Nephila pilipes TaxID=299642 RepID=A0A8X6PJ79_NEPPI|nr:uncharacterized protein NPIL_405511 [Nephila pilipes]